MGLFRKSTVSKQRLLIDAAKAGDLPRVRRLLAKGADVRAKDERDRTALHEAGEWGHAAVVEELIAGGGDVRAGDVLAWTPLHGACRRGHVAAVEALIAGGSDVGARAKDMLTPLHEASGAGHAAAAEALISGGADVDARDCMGLRPLHKASGRGHVAAAEALIARGCDVDARDNEGWTPLHDASSRGKVAVVKMLIARGADVHAKDNIGSTPLHRASSNGHIATVEALIDGGARIDARNNAGRTPHDIAKSNHQDAVVEYMEGADAHLLEDAGYRLISTDQDLLGLSEVANENAKVAAGSTIDLAASTGAPDGTPNESELLAAAMASEPSDPPRQAWGYQSNTTQSKVARLREAISQSPAFNRRRGSPEIMDFQLDALIEQGDWSGVTRRMRSMIEEQEALAQANMRQEIADQSKQESREAGSLRSMIEEQEARGNSQTGHSNDRVMVGSSVTHSEPPKFSAAPVQKGGDRISAGGEYRGAQEGHSENTKHPQLNLTEDDFRFLKMGRELVKRGGSIPAIQGSEREALRALTANIVHFEHSLESVRGLPASLEGKPRGAAEYFFFVTAAFERVYSAAMAVGSGCVKVRSAEGSAVESVLGAAGLAAERSGLPFAGCVSILSAIAVHQRETRQENLLSVFADFFRGESRDQYLIAHRRLAERLCLRLDAHGAGAERVGGLRSHVKEKIIDPIKTYLAEVHLRAVREMGPLEEMAMSHLAYIAKEILRLYQNDRRTFQDLRESDEHAKAIYFENLLFGQAHSASFASEPRQADSQIAHESQVGAEAVESVHLMMGKIQRLEEHNNKLQKQVVSNAKVQDLKLLQMELKKIAAKVESQKDVDNLLQVQINSNRISREGKPEIEQVNRQLGHLEEELRQVQIRQEDQSRDLGNMKLDNFINNRVLSRQEAFEVAHRILSLSKDVDGKQISVSENGEFVFNGNKACIGTVRFGRVFTKKKVLWKGRAKVKLEHDHGDVKSIMYWFDEINLGCLYERNKMRVLRALFSSELCLETGVSLGHNPDSGGDRNELFDCSPSLR